MLSKSVAQDQNLGCLAQQRIRRPPRIRIDQTFCRRDAEHRNWHEVIDRVQGDRLSPVDGVEPVFGGDGGIRTLDRATNPILP